MAAEMFVNILRPKENGYHFANYIFKISSKENASILIKISVKFVPSGPTDNELMLVGTEQVTRHPLTPMLTMSGLYR